MKQNAFNILIMEMNMGIKQRRPFIFCPYSIKNLLVLRALLNKGLILGFFKLDDGSAKLCVFIKYWDQKSIIKKLYISKKNGVNRLKSKKDLQFGDVKANGLSIISTSLGGICISDFGYRIPTGGILIAKIKM